MTTTAAATGHKITWLVYVGATADTRERIRRTASMRGRWDYDAMCSCGWDSKTGGALERYVRTMVADHKADAADTTDYRALAVAQNAARRAAPLRIVATDRDEADACDASTPGCKINHTAENKVGIVSSDCEGW
jgi:hypothetical protein